MSSQGEQRRASGGVAAHTGHDTTGIGSGAKVVYCRDCQVHVKVGGR